MLSLTAIVWGWGFVLNDQLLSQMHDTPTLLNAIRFTVAAVVLLVLFAKKIVINKQTLLYSCVGGTFLFLAFWLQIIGLKYTTPAHSGFFTASYVVFVPFIVWIIGKKRPTLSTLIGVAVALAGLAILNFKSETGVGNTLTGDLITLGSAVMFALQIVWGENVLTKKKADHYTFTAVQLATAAILFVVASVALENKYYPSLNIDFGFCWWRFALVSLLGTTFAYFAQTYSQIHMPSSETALILGCESPIGAVISIAVGLDTFSWNIVIGGLLVIAAVVLVEVVPQIVSEKGQEKQPDENE